MFREMPGIGRHEVVIESPQHNARLDEMQTDDVARVVQIWLRRYSDLIGRSETRAVVVFKNFGALAGTSLPHTHSQIVATPVFLPRLLRRLDVATRYFDDTGSCVYDDLLVAEREAGLRIVLENRGFAAFEPFASGSPFETWILPIEHRASFGDLDDDEARDLAEILIGTLAALRRAAGDPDYNLVIYSVPRNGYEEVFHWHLKIVPKLTTVAGFELGSAMGVNVLAPEDAAVAMRTAVSDARIG